MLIFMILICLASLAVGILIIVNKSLSLAIKIPIVGLCAISFSISLFINLIMFDGWRIERNARQFLISVIEDSRKGIYPSVSQMTISAQKEQFYMIIKALPETDYQISFHDNFGDFWEYEVHFDNGQSYFISVDAPGTFFILFGDANYCLGYIEEIETGPKAR